MYALFQLEVVDIIKTACGCDRRTTLGSEVTSCCGRKSNLAIALTCSLHSIIMSIVFISASMVFPCACPVDHDLKFLFNECCFNDVMYGLIHTPELQSIYCSNFIFYIHIDQRRVRREAE